QWGPRPRIPHTNFHVELGSKSRDVVAPKNTFDLGQIGFSQIGAAAGWFEIHTANLYIQAVFFGSHHKIRAISAEFVADLIADVCGDRDHRSRNRRAQSDGDGDQQLSPRLPPK